MSRPSIRGKTALRRFLFSAALAAPSTALAVPPTGLTALFVGPTSVGVGWNPNGNAPGTQFQVQTSPDNISWTTVVTTTFTAAVVPGLVANTTTFFQVLAGGVPPPSNNISAYTPAAVTFSNGVNASNVLGQAGFAGGGTGLSAAAFNNPSGLLYDPVNQRLFASDAANNRVVVFDLTAGAANGMNAAFVLGQGNLTSNGAGTASNNLSGPTGLAYDQVSQLLYVSDSGNNRILVFNLSAGLSNGMAASNVLGQAAYGVNGAATTQNGLSTPAGLAFDQADRYLFAADSVNHRVLVFDMSGSVTDGMNASFVLGEPNFVSNTPALTQGGMNSPVGVAYDIVGQTLFVAESGNDRVTAFSLGGGALANGMNAFHVLGQANFTSNASAVTQSSLGGPKQIFFDNTSRALYVADNGGKRLLSYDLSGGISDGMNANVVMGEPNFTTAAGGLSPALMNAATQGTFDAAGQRLFVSDSGNNRVLVFGPTAPPTFGANPITAATSGTITAQWNLVPGATGYTLAAAQLPINPPLFPAASSTTAGGVATVSSLNPGNTYYLFVLAVGGAAPSPYVLLGSTITAPVAPSSTTVLWAGPAGVGVGWNPNGNGAGVTYLVQRSPDNATWTTIQSTTFTSVVAGGLASGTTYYFRVQPRGGPAGASVSVFTPGAVSLSSAINASFVLGQGGFTTSAGALGPAALSGGQSLAYDAPHQRLFVADSANNRVLMFDLTAGLANGMSAVHVLGQANLNASGAATTAAGMSAPGAVAYDAVDQWLFVGDGGNRRVLVFDLSAGASDGMAAFHVLGQPNFTSNAAAVTPVGLSGGGGLAFDPADRFLFVADQNAHRVVVYFLQQGLMDGMPATSVLGEPDLLSNTPGLTQSAMNAPVGVAYDVAGQTLYVSELGNRRVLAFALGGGALVNGMNAANVLGQANFTANTGATTQSGMLGPRQLDFDAVNRRLYVAEFENKRVLAFDVAGGVTNGMNASLVLGEPGFTSNAGGTSAGLMAGAHHAVFDPVGQRLFVADFANNRVLAFGQTPAPAVASPAVLAVTTATIQAQWGLVPGATGYNFVVSPTSVTITVAASSATALTTATVSGLAATTTYYLFVSASGGAAPSPFALLGSTMTLTPVLSPPPANLTVLWVSSATAGLAWASNGNSSTTVYALQSFNGASWTTVLTTSFTAAAVTGLVPSTSYTWRVLAGAQASLPAAATTTPFDEIFANGENATRVLGQAGFASAGSGGAAAGLNAPGAVLLDAAGRRVFAVDTGNNRVLVYDRSSGISNGMSASFVLGQTGLSGAGAGTSATSMSAPQALAYDAARQVLFVADVGNNRVLAFDLSAGVTNGMAASYVLGQSSFNTNIAATTQSGMSVPYALAYDPAARQLFVADWANNRVLGFDLSTTVASGMNANLVLGQANFTSNAQATTQSGLAEPTALAYAYSIKTLFVGDGFNERVLAFDLSAGAASGMNASRVLGQANFVSNTESPGASGVGAPVGIAYDPGSKRLFVSAAGATVVNRALVFNLSGGIVNNMNASFVLGEPDFATMSGGAAQNLLSGPLGLDFDPGNRTLAVADTSNNRLLFFGQTGTPAALSPAVLSASSSTIQARWGLVTDATSYTLVASTNNVNPPSPSTAAAASATNVGTLTGLSLGTSYYLFVSATGGGGPSPFAALGLAVTAANGGSNIQAISSSTLQVGWPTSGFAAGSFFTAQLSTAADFTGQLASSVSAAGQAVFAGLTPNTLYSLRVRAPDNTYAPTLAAVTLATAPASSALVSVSTNQITLAWTANGDPAGTQFQAQASTTAAFTAATASTTVSLSATLQALTPNTSYFARVEAMNQIGVASAFDVVLATVTAAAVPGTPAFTSLSSTSLTAAWNAAGNPADTSYVTQLSTASDFSGTPSTRALAAGAATFSPLQNFTTYYLRVMAVDRVGRPTAFSSSASAQTGGTPPAQPALAAVSLSSTSVVWQWTITAGPLSGFRLWSSTGGLIAQLPAAATYYTESGLATGQRYSAYLEARNAGGSTFSSTATAATAASFSLGFVAAVINDPVTGKPSISIPANFSTQPVTILLTSDPVLMPLKATTPALIAAATKLLPKGVSGSTSSLREYLLTVGESTFGGTLQQAVTISVPYPDVNNTGFVDGVSPPLAATALRLFTLNETTGLWEELPGTKVDLVNHVVTAPSPHLSIFTAFGAGAATTLTGVRVYPVPYSPNGSNPDSGKPYSPSDPTSGIIFDQLPDEVTIKIMDMAGRLVAEFESKATGGALRWDARNGNGRDVATGGYLAIITSPGAKAVVKRLLIIR